jgi:hypothetical protein
VIRDGGDLRSRELMRRERYALRERPRRAPFRLRWAGGRARRRRRRALLASISLSAAAVLVFVLGIAGLIAG